MPQETENALPSLDDFPGINEALVRKYAEGASEWGVAQLLILFDHFRKCAGRAEYLSAFYLKRMQELELRLSASGERNTLASPVREPNDRQLGNNLRKVQAEAAKPKRITLEQLLEEDGEE